MNALVTWDLMVGAILVGAGAVEKLLSDAAHAPSKLMPLSGIDSQQSTLGLSVVGTAIMGTALTRNMLVPWRQCGTVEIFFDGSPWNGTPHPLNSSGGHIHPTSTCIECLPANKNTIHAILVRNARLTYSGMRRVEDNSFGPMGIAANLMTLRQDSLLLVSDHVIDKESFLPDGDYLFTNLDAANRKGLVLMKHDGIVTLTHVNRTC